MKTTPQFDSLIEALKTISGRVEGDIRHGYPPGTPLDQIVDFEVLYNGEWVPASTLQKTVVVL